MSFGSETRMNATEKIVIREFPKKFMYEVYAQRCVVFWPLPSYGLVYSQIYSSLFSFIFHKSLKPPFSGGVVAFDVVKQCNFLKNVMPAFHLTQFAQQSRCIQASLPTLNIFTQNSCQKT